MKRFGVTTFLAVLFSLGVTTASPPAAAEGSIPHGYPQSSWPTVADEARISEWGAYGLATMLQQVYRSGAGTYLDVCTDTGFLCVAGTGFNVNVSPGICLYNDAAGAVAPIPAFRYVQELAATEVTDWDANPGADTYYVHVYYNDATADGVVSSDPTYIVDTTANPVGAELTVCSIVVAGAEPDATTYTYNDLRVIGNGLHYMPTAVASYTAADIEATDDLLVGDDAQVTGDLNVTGATTGGPAGGPTTWGVDVATGAPTWGPVGTELGGIDPATGTWYHGVVGAEACTCDATGIFGAATTIATAGGTAVPVSAFYDDIATAGSGAATTGLLPVADGAAGIAWGTTTADSYGAETVLAAALAADDGAGGDAAAGTVPISDGAGGADWGDLIAASFAATPAEIDAVADLSAAGMLPRTCVLAVDSAGGRTAGAHAICTLPATALVEDVYVGISAQEASGTTTVDVGPAGTADGYANDLSVAAGGLFRPRATLTTGGTETYFASTTRGSLLATLVAGADAAGDVGTYYEFPDTASGGLVVSYTVPAGGWTEFTGTFIVRYRATP